MGAENPKSGAAGIPEPESSEPAEAITAPSQEETAGSGSGAGKPETVSGGDAGKPRTVSGGDSGKPETVSGGDSGKPETVSGGDAGKPETVSGGDAGRISYNVVLDGSAVDYDALSQQLSDVSGNQLLMLESMERQETQNEACISILLIFLVVGVLKYLYRFFGMFFPSG